MVWDINKKGMLDVGGELIHFEVKIPSALDMEEIISTKDENGLPAIKDSDVVKKFCLSVEGFPTVEAFLKCGRTLMCMKAIAGFIIESSKLDCELKN